MGLPGRLLEFLDIVSVKLRAERIEDAEYSAELPLAVLQHEDERQVYDHWKRRAGVDLDLRDRKVAGQVELAFRRLPHGIADQKIDIGVGGKRHSRLPH